MLGLPFFEVHDCGALVGQDGLIRVHTAVKLVTEQSSLNNGASMACHLRPSAAHSILYKLPL